MSSSILTMSDAIARAEAFGREMDGSGFRFRVIVERDDVQINLVSTPAPERR